MVLRAQAGAAFVGAAVGQRGGVGPIDAVAAGGQQGNAGRVMFGLDLSVVGLALALVTGVGSLFIGRYLRRSRMEKRRAKERAAAQAAQSRQVRRARERSQRK